MDGEQIQPPPTESDALDAYSRVVTGVAARVLPSVAALAVRSARGNGAGSAVTFTADGLLLTSAHVVDGAEGGNATFADGTESRFDVVGADPSPTWPYSGSGRPVCRRPNSATPTGSGSANSWWPWATRWGWPAR